MPGSLGPHAGGTGGRIGDTGGHVRARDDPIDVLLVDDNQQWAQFMATELAEQSSQIAVSVALSVNEAMLTLRDSAEIECVVTDYRMPEIDGLQFLERLREERPALPFILVTGEGSEDLASKAIDTGVSDYLVKNPRTNQTAIFLDKIKSAVTQHRLQQSIQESERRYRTVTEQSRDGIAIVQDEMLVFWNQRLCEMTGRDDESLSSVDFVTDLVHEDDRTQMASIIERWADGEDVGVYDTQLQTVDGGVRDCTVTGGRIVYEDDPAVLLSIRDVTERKRRERELAWERELNRTIQQILVESRTRDRLEGAVASLLCDHGYAMAWFGEVVEGSLVPRVVEGDDSYVEALDLSVDGAVHDSEPSLWAVRSNEPKFVRNFEELFSTAWQESALEQDFHSGGAVPIVHNDVSYGVLAVYHDAPGRFDEAERDLLTELGHTVAFAIHNIGTEVALASDHAVRATVTLNGTPTSVSEIARSESMRNAGGTINIRGTVPYEDGFLQYVSLDGISTEAFHKLADEYAVDVTVIDEDRGRLQVQVPTEPPEAMLASRGVVVRSTTVEPGGTTLTLDVPAKAKLRPIVDELEREFEDAAVKTIYQADTDHERTTESKLTAKQSAALQAAYHHGYFEQPRKSSATDVADALGIAHSTFLQHLRTAQQKLFEPRFE
ncbi:MAG: bacterio-opsin activator domain-containing protein [Natrinema limicola]